MPVLGGEPTRLLAHSSGLSWIEPVSGQRRVMFSSMPGKGIHMGSLRIHGEPVGIAHRLHAGLAQSAWPIDLFFRPIGRSVLIVEMDLGSWQPCRLVPFDGSSAGTRVGPQPAQCTDAAWSPDGKWMYMAANTGDGFHIWRQRFPNGKPEQVTSGATEEQGISFAPDGRSFVTSVGGSQSTLWVHDAKGDRADYLRRVSRFSPPFRATARLFITWLRSRANRRFVSGELMVG